MYKLIHHYLALLAATHQADLVVEDHDCVRVWALAGRAAASAFLAAFPVVVRPHPSGPDAFVLSAGPVTLYAALLEEAAVLPPGVRLALEARPCACKAQHAVIPTTATTSQTSARHCATKPTTRIGYDGASGTSAPLL